MPTKDYEPAESMYPVSFGSMVFTKHPTLWQAHSTSGATIFFEADTAEEAYHRAQVIFGGENFEYRRLPILTIKKEKSKDWSEKQASLVVANLTGLRNLR